MAKRKTVKVTVNCVANHYSAANEQIVEVSDSRGLGCLISIRESVDGRLVVEVYRADKGVVVQAGGAEMPAHREDEQAPAGGTEVARGAWMTKG